MTIVCGSADGEFCRFITCYKFKLLRNIKVKTKIKVTDVGKIYHWVTV